MLVKDLQIGSYAEAEAMLGKRDQRTLCLNTWLSRESDSGTICVTYHNTHIVFYKTDGSVVLNSGGWKTTTTKARIDKLLPPNWGLFQRKFEWFLEYLPKGTVYRFADMCSVASDGWTSGLEAVAA